MGSSGRECTLQQLSERLSTPNSNRPHTTTKPGRGSKRHLEHWFEGKGAVRSAERVQRSGNRHQTGDWLGGGKRMAISSSVSQGSLELPLASSDYLDVGGAGALHVGHRCSVKNRGAGTVRFVGKVKQSLGIGVALDTPTASTTGRSAARGTSSAPTATVSLPSLRTCSQSASLRMQVMSWNRWKGSELSQARCRMMPSSALTFRPLVIAAPAWVRNCYGVDLTGPRSHVPTQPFVVTKPTHQHAVTDCTTYQRRVTDPALVATGCAVRSVAAVSNWSLSRADQLKVNTSPLPTGTKTRTPGIFGAPLHGYRIVLYLHYTQRC
eukprot:m.366658 g.366658  ORF g.366658 m.366658 type:complete len:323 (+) comp28096_c0_seq17:1951-2919(+)